MGKPKKRWTPHPSQRKDPEFVRFYTEQFHQELEKVIIPGWPEVSWDRRAAYMVWRARQRDKKS